MLRIKKARNGYMATGTPPDTLFDFHTYEPVIAPILIQDLRLVGAKVTDIEQALSKADPHWKG